MSVDQVYDMVNVLNTISNISNRVLSSSQRKLFLNCFFSLDGKKYKKYNKSTKEVQEIWSVMYVLLESIVW